MKTDFQLMADVTAELDSDPAINAKAIGAAVNEGLVTLTGQVDWPYQFSSAEQCVRPLLGVRGVSNQVVIKPRVRGKDIAGQIAAALQRHAEREAGHIDVAVEGSIVTLSGRVDSMAEHDAVVGAAFGTRGVSTIVDKLEVGA